MILPLVTRYVQPNADPTQYDMAWVGISPAYGGGTIPNNHVFCESSSSIEMTLCRISVKSVVLISH